MRFARFGAAALTILIIAGMLAAHGRAQQAAPAGLTKQTWTVDGVERSALVSAPRTPLSGAGSPLVFVFHGHGGTSAQASRSFRIHEAWPEALVIYPQGLPNVGQVTDPQGKQPGWQHSPGGDADRDLHLVDAMFAWAAKTYSVDRARVFAAGHSNGGSMVYVLWAAQGDRFAAFAPSSSVFKLELVTTAKPKPAFIVTGQKDALVPPVAQQLSLRGVLRLNRAAADGTDWSGGVKKHASSIGADVFTYIHPGGHPMPADAGAMMVKFFKSVQSSPGTEESRSRASIVERVRKGSGRPDRKRKKQNCEDLLAASSDRNVAGSGSGRVQCGRGQLAGQSGPGGAFTFVLVRHARESQERTRGRRVLAGRRLVFWTFWGAEGQLIVLFQSRDGKLVELIRNYRYASPF